MKRSAHATDDLKSGVFVMCSPAVVHGDEQGYLWLQGRVGPQDYHGNSTASRSLRRQLEWWTNFIKLGYVSF